MSAVLPVRKNYQLLDAWRGLASLFVVALHSLTPTATLHPGLKDALLFRVASQGGLGVHVFFVISGYCIAVAACSNLRRKQGLAAFVKARIRRIYPTMWAGVALTFGMAVLAYVLLTRGVLTTSEMGQKDMLHQPFVYYFANVTLAQIALRQGFVLFVCWTLCYEIAFYALVSVALWAVRQRDGRALLDLLHGITLLSLTWLLLAPHRIVYPLDFWPEFGLGVLLYDILQNPTLRRPKALFVSACLLTLTFVCRNARGIGPLGRVDSVAFGTALAFTLMAALLYRYDDVLIKCRPARALAWIGSFSYSLYLVHLVPVTFAQQVFKRIRPLQNQHWLLLALCLIASILFAYGFFLLFERPFLSGKAKSRREEENRAMTAVPAGAPPQAG